MHKKRGIRSSKRRGPFCYLFVLRLFTIYFSLGNGKREPLRPPFSPNKLRDYLVFLHLITLPCTLVWLSYMILKSCLAAYRWHRA
uniref:Uncharacterized protein n=1 Tax=Picea glauca TaxID=3330 RepID=A0A101LZ73_PICGL|nr:hypothetical protein ABT39_MTgene5051 [Picea glauca]